MSVDPILWWNELLHSGLLLDRKRLSALYTEELWELPVTVIDRLRELIELDKPPVEIIDLVLGSVTGFSTGWKKGPQVDISWSRKDLDGSVIRPERIWLGPNGSILPLFIDKESSSLGVGRGRKHIGRILRWLRAGNEKLAVLTNGRQWRVIFAGLDYDAWCQLDSELWFDDGAPSLQFEALRYLLDPKVWTVPPDSDRPPLLAAIEETRKGQADLSSSLGERVRIAVEKLLDAHQLSIDAHGQEINPADLYRGAVRMVMRLVVVLFAEARELLPVGNPIYQSSYGVQSLQERLRKLSRSHSFSESHSAWPRLLALFRLVHDGSAHPDMAVQGYGGELFEPGSKDSLDGLKRAVWIFENAAGIDSGHSIKDSVILTILDHLTRTVEKIRSGRSTISVPVPVDFSDLSSEYIGILYEGLLDYELKKVAAGEAIILLPIGNAPALPLSRLEAMDDRELGDLLSKFAKEGKAKADAAESEEEASDSEESSEEEMASEEDSQTESEGELEAQPSESDESPLAQDEHGELGSRVTAFLKRLVEVGKLVQKPRGRVTPERQASYESEVVKKSLSLARDVHYPGKRYLVRWGGTRKGSGAFYTRPGLSGPLIHRTLAPLAYEAPKVEQGHENRDTPLTDWIPKKPEEILALKVCDIACGSGTFPVGALRFLTQALWDSVNHHRRLQGTGDNRTAMFLYGKTGAGETLADEYLPCLPDDATYEHRLRARLKRHVAERCIYGVDLDPLAVELCRLALWVETLDPELPFTFLNHKVKCGNSLVGCWYDRFRHYPVMAFLREAADSKHPVSVNHPQGTDATLLANHFKDEVLPDLEATITGQGDLFRAARGTPSKTVHEDLRRKMEELHALPSHAASEREGRYRSLLDDPDYISVKSHFDLWCALWFWPISSIASSPLPSNFLKANQVSEEVARHVAASQRFFHWELEFPEVFTAAGAGFDAVIGNPPWDISKPSSKEYFSNHDPLFRLYEKQEASTAQRELFRENLRHEDDWLDYCTRFKDFGHWVRHAGNPFGERTIGEESSRGFSFGRGKDSLHDAWSSARKSSSDFAASDPSHPFLHQGGGDTNLYKCFLEQIHALLREGGRFGQIIPSGIHTDQGTKPLRQLLYDSCSWEWCFCFENRKKIFPIDSRFKFDLLIIEKGGSTTSIRSSFMRLDSSDWLPGVAEGLCSPYSLKQVVDYSRINGSLMELRGSGDTSFLDRAYSQSNCLLGDTAPTGWVIQYRTEFHLTNDSQYFPRRGKWEEEGYVQDQYGRWICGNWREGTSGNILSRAGNQSINPEDVSSTKTEIKVRSAGGRRAERKLVDHSALAVPLYQGVMVWHFDFCYRCDLSSNGASDWQPPSGNAPVPLGKYLIPLDFLPKATRPRIGFRDIGANTNQRTLAAAMLPPFPHANKVPILSPQRGSQFAFLSCLCSFVADAALRLKISQATINWFYMEELPLPPPDSPFWTPAFDRLVLGLCGRSAWFANEWLESVPDQLKSIHAWRSWWADSFAERQRRRAVIDAVVAHAYGVTLEDVEWLLRDCFHPCEYYSNRSNRGGLDQKGFWRVDEHLPVSTRHTWLFLQAYKELKRVLDTGLPPTEAVDKMVGKVPGEGWILPEESAASFCERGEDQRTAGRDQTPLESWEEVMNHKKELYETPLWTGALA